MAATLAGVAIAGYIAYYGIDRELVIGSSEADGRDLVYPENEALMRHDLQLELDANRHLALAGVVANQATDYVITSIGAKVEFRSKPVYCQKPRDTDCSNSDKPHEDWMNKYPLHSGLYECYRGKLTYMQQAECRASIAYTADFTKEYWSYRIVSIKGRPADPLGFFR